MPRQAQRPVVCSLFTARSDDVAEKETKYTPNVSSVCVVANCQIPPRLRFEPIRKAVAALELSTRTAHERTLGLTGWSGAHACGSASIFPAPRGVPPLFSITGHYIRERRRRRRVASENGGAQSGAWPPKTAKPDYTRTHAQRILLLVKVHRRCRHHVAARRRSKMLPPLTSFCFLAALYDRTQWWLSIAGLSK